MVHTQRVSEADISDIVRFVFVDHAVPVHVRSRPIGPRLNDGKVIHGVRVVGAGDTDSSVIAPQRPTVKVAGVVHEVVPLGAVTVYSAEAV